MSWNWTAIATILLALFTAILAFFSWQSITQNLALRKRQTREGYLKEIIDWGESIKRCSFVTDSDELIGIMRLISEDKRKVWALKNEYQYSSAGVKYTYIKNIASSFDGDLKAAVDAVSRAVAAHVLLLRDEFDGKTKENDVPDNIDKIKQTVNQMIEISTQILVKN